MISNELDIDFIHGDIHGRSCKNDILWFDITLWHDTAWELISDCTLQTE